MELASLSNRFAYFENFEEKEAEKAKNRPKRLSPTRELAFVSVLKIAMQG